MAEKNNRFKLNNEGSALVTVLIVALFISILATTILYLASRNYIMKQTDRKNKESFYETEATVETIKAHLEIMASMAYEEAFGATLSQYASVDTNTRTQTFFNAFINSFSNQWNADLALSPNFYDGLRAANPLIQSINYGTLDTADATASGKRAVYVRGVTVEYENTDGYYSKITTDFLIEIPLINLGVDQYTAVDEAVSSNDKNTAELVQYTNWERE